MLKFLFSDMTFNKTQLEGRIILAPLAGVSDSAFRLICRKMGAAIVFTEMISADGLLQKNLQSLNYLFFRPEERPIGFQLFGSEPAKMASAVEVMMSYQPDFIDLNFGCPVKKVVRRGAGAALLKNVNRLRQITEEVVRISPVPVVAKIRQGWDENQVNAVEVAKILEGCGVQAITIHPRTQAQQYRGHSDWSIIGKLKEAVSIPIIGNGDVKTADDAKRMIDETGCDLVMIGRGSLGNPWIFREANYFLQTGNKLAPPTLPERLNLIFQHLEDIVALKGLRSGVHEMRKHLGWYTKGFPKSAQIRSELFNKTSVEEIKECLANYFSDLPHQTYQEASQLF